MKRLKVKDRFQANATILPNEFIDHYMVSANGEFMLKVYLLLLGSERAGFCPDGFHDR